MYIYIYSPIDLSDSSDLSGDIPYYCYNLTTAIYDGVVFRRRRGALRTRQDGAHLCPGLVRRLLKIDLDQWDMNYTWIINTVKPKFRLSTWSLDNKTKWGETGKIPKLWQPTEGMDAHDSDWFRIFFDGGCDMAVISVVTMMRCWHLFGG